MKEESFRYWLSNSYRTANNTLLNANTVSSRLANCKTVERYEGDIDQHFDKDHFNDLLILLTYSAEDKQRNRPARHSIPINGDIKDGTATLKSGISLYKQFCESRVPEQEIQAQTSDNENELNRLKQDYAIQGEELREVQRQLDSAKNEIISLTNNFPDMAKKIAKQIAGEDENFSHIIDSFPLDNHFPGEIKRVLLRLLKEVLGVGHQNNTLSELIRKAYDENKFSKEAKIFADTIRTLRNLVEYEEIDTNLDKCRVLIVLFTFSGFWRYIKGNNI